MTLEWGKIVALLHAVMASLCSVWVAFQQKSKFDNSLTPFLRWGCYSSSYQRWVEQRYSKARSRSLCLNGRFRLVDNTLLRWYGSELDLDLMSLFELMSSTVLLVLSLWNRFFLLRLLRGESMASVCFNTTIYLIRNSSIERTNTRSRLVKIWILRCWCHHLARQYTIYHMRYDKRSSSSILKLSTRMGILELCL